MQPRKTELERRLEEAARKEQEVSAGEDVATEAPLRDAEPERPSEAAASADAAAPEALSALIAERDALKDQVLRLRAEFDNYRKRMIREAERVRQTAAEGVMRDLLPVVDHIELAVQHRDQEPEALASGVDMVLRQFQDVLRRWGVEPIVAKGAPFDPEVHEAVLQQPSEEVPAHAVLEEFQRGYRMGALVLRPTKVVVSAGSAMPKTQAQDTHSVPAEMVDS